MLSKWVQNVPKKSNYVNTFLGVNFTENYQEGEIANGKNLSTEKYPCLYQRKGRTVVYTGVENIFEWGGHFVYVKGGKLYLDNTVIKNSGMVTRDRQFAVLNTKLIIWPDKLMVDLTDNSVTDLTSTNVGTSWKVTENQIIGPAVYSAVTDNFVSGNDNSLKLYICGTNIDETADAWDGTNWSVEAETVKWYDVTVGMCFVTEEELAGYYLPVIDRGSGKPSTYNSTGHFGSVTAVEDVVEEGVTKRKITWKVYLSNTSTASVFSSISSGDCLYVSVGGNPSTNRYFHNCLVESVHGNTITFTENYFDSAAPFTGAVGLKKEIPDLDYICSINNRLWGVNNSEKTIYSSALGLPDKWFDYSSDTAGSYAVAVASEGDFTGIVAYADSVYCFKENHCHKVMGSYPSEYYITEYTIPGIKPGCSRSAVVINNVLYYQGTAAVYAYTGGTPSNISYKINPGEYLNGVGGTDGKNYYLSVTLPGDDEEGRTFVYDLTHGIWTIDDHSKYECFCTDNGKIYGQIGSVFYNISEGTENYPWYAEFTPFYAASTYNGKPSVLMNRKGLTRLIVRMDLAAGAGVDVELKLDNGEYKTVCQQRSQVNKTLLIPIRIGRCDKYSIRLSGTGYCMVRSIYREYSFGSMR